MNAEEYKLMLTEDSKKFSWNHKRHRRYENRIWIIGELARKAEESFGLEFIGSNILSPFSELEQDFDSKLKDVHLIFRYLFALTSEKAKVYAIKVGEILKGKKEIFERNKEIDKNFQLNSSYYGDFLRAYYGGVGQDKKPDPIQIRNLERFVKEFDFL